MIETTSATTLANKKWSPSLPIAGNGVEQLIGLSFLEYRAHPAIAQSDLKLAYSDPQLFSELSCGQWSKPQPTKSMLFGIDMERFLRNGPGDVVIVPREVLSKSGQRRGKKWDEFKSAHEFRTLLKEEEYDESVKPFVRAYENTVRHTSASYLLHSSVEERCWSRQYSWQEAGLHMKGELDLILPQQRIIVDIKTTIDERPAEFAKSIVNWRYDVQAVQYLTAMEQLTGDEWTYYWLCIRNKMPYSVSVIECDDEWRRLGKDYRDLYIENITRRTEENDWLADDQPQVCEIPRWERGPYGQ